MVRRHYHPGQDCGLSSSRDRGTLLKMNEKPQTRDKKLGNYGVEATH